MCIEVLSSTVLVFTVQVRTYTVLSLKLGSLVQSTQAAYCGEPSTTNF